MANRDGAASVGGSGRGGSSGHRAGRKRRSGARRVVLVAGSVLAVLTLIGVGVVGFAWWKWNGFDRVSVDLDDASSNAPQNFLFVGSDSRENISAEDPDAGGFLDGEFGGKRSDTVMVARIDPGAGTMSLLSIPRDLWLPIGVGGEFGEGRINAAYGEGPQVLVDTIATNLGIEINHYVEVDFRGFKGLVDALGGIPLYFDLPMYDEYTGLDIPEAGCVVMSGDQALAFARARHVQVQNPDGEWVSDFTADLGRITRQQLFMRKALDKASSLGLTDVGKLNKLSDVAADNVSFDPGLSLGDAVSLGRKFAAFAGDQLKTYQLPTVDYETSDGSAVLQIDPVAAAPILDIFRGVVQPATPAPGDGVALTPAQVTVSVLNGTGIDGQASEAAAVLGEHGFALGPVGDAGESVSRTRLVYGTGHLAAAQLVQSMLVGGAQLVEDPTVTTGVDLVTGSDFGGISAVTTTTTAPADPTNPAEVTTTTHVGFIPEAPPPGLECR